ncbi:MAG TPA: HmuY family protein, partial [Flavipsychrobacter sp.]
AMGDWRSAGGLSKNDIYIVKLNPTYDPNNLKKMRLLYVSTTEYVLEYADLDEKVTHTITIPKDENYNYSYFTFRDGGKTIQPDPPKNTWDIVFTRYRYVYYELDNFPYMVNGVLLNPYRTIAAKDTSTAFADLEGTKITELQYSNHRDVIGFDWKEYNFDTERYEINRKKTYVIKNRKDQYYKLRFLDFYNKQGIKGSPSFEFQRAY